MLFKNNNKKVIKKLTSKTLKSNATRNIFVVLAIVLTTFMISSVFSIGFSFAKNYEVMMLRLQGTTASIALQAPTEKQVNEFKKIDDITEVGTVIKAGTISTELLEDEDTNIILQYSDNANWSEQTGPAISDIVGAYPKKENEVMASRWSLENLGINNPSVGMEIDLSYKVNGVERSKTFVLTGYYTEYGFSMSTGNIMVSKAFIEANNLSLEGNGTVLLTVDPSKQSLIEEQLEKKITLHDNQEFSYSYDNAAEVESTQIATIIVIVVIALFIVLSGYLLIYNVLYIAVTKDIRFYGLLKTIGASPKQIKKIVRGQALRLAGAGVPIGLLLGAFVSFMIVPMALTSFGSGGSPYYTMPTDVYFSPIIFVGAALFALGTVLISSYKPAKIAGNISPVEAVHFTGVKQKKQKTNRKSTNGGKLHKMAFYNVFRDKKRAMVVFLSLFMGVITFLSINTFMSSLSVDNYIKQYVSNDFTIQQLHPLTDKIDQPFIDEIAGMNGVETVGVKKVSQVNFDHSDDFFLPFIKNGLELWGEGTEEELSSYLADIKQNPEHFTAWATSVDTNQVQQLNRDFDLSIDIEAFERGEIALVSTFFIQEEYKQEVDKLNGKTFSITDQKTGIETNYTLVGIPTYDLGNGLPASLGSPDIIISHNAMKQLNPDAFNYLVDIDVQGKYEPEIKQKLSSMIAKDRNLILAARSDKAEDFASSTQVMNILGGGMSIILILIGILNFINVMVTGVNVRLKELAVMESIGMTKKQIKKMLMLEGFYYAGISALLVCTVGMAIIFGIAKLAAIMADYAQFVFPTIPLISLIAAIFIICLATPVIVFRTVSKASVTERLKMNEH